METRAREDESNRQVYEEGAKEINGLRTQLQEFKDKAQRQEVELNEVKSKFKEMQELCDETEKVIQRRVGKYEKNLAMKEEEVARIKQILYGREDEIKNMANALEQAGHEIQARGEEIDYYRQKVREYEQESPENLISQNLNLQAQNKQLLVMLINHLTKSKARKGSKSKKNKF